MSYESLLIAAYALVPIIGVIGYGSQIISLLKVKGPLQGFSCATWSVWLFSWMISLVYGAFKLGDVMFCVAALANIVPIIAIIAIALYKSRSPALEINARINQHIDQIANQVHYEGDQRINIKRAEDDRIIAVNDTFIAQESKTIQ